MDKNLKEDLKNLQKDLEKRRDSKRNSDILSILMRHFSFTQEKEKQAH